MATTHPLLFQGTLLDRQGNAVEGAKIQLWQTDLDGNYLHPQADSFPASPEHASIVSQFQYFGTDTTDSYGSFDFLTYRPGIYTQRPYSHFHFMVWLDDLAMGDAETPALITQFYFKDESPPSWFPAVLQLDVTEADPAAYEYGSYVNGTIVVDVNPTGGNALLAASPAQPKGPFYPKTDFFSVGNDLTTSDDATTQTTAAPEASPRLPTAPTPATAQPVNGVASSAPTTPTPQSAQMSAIERPAPPVFSKPTAQTLQPMRITVAEPPAPEPTPINNNATLPISTTPTSKPMQTASSSAASLGRPACGNAWSWWIVCYVAVRNFIL